MKWKWQLRTGSTAAAGGCCIEIVAEAVVDTDLLAAPRSAESLDHRKVAGLHSSL